MAERISRTRGADAPLSSAKDPNPAAAGLDVTDDDDVLVGRTVTINRSRQELYEFWRDFRNLPLFMENIESVDVMDGNRSHWVVRGAGGHGPGVGLAVITEDVPGEVIAWRSVEGASVDNSGRIEFRDSSNGRGTVVSVTIAYDPPGGTLGKVFAKIFRREPKIQARHGSAPLQAAHGNRRDCRPRRRTPTPRPEQIRHRRFTCAHSPGRAKHDVRVETVPDPQIVNPRDAIIRITSTAICGSDLHLYDHYIPGMKDGDILGHEFMGEVVEVGARQQEAQGRAARGGAVRDRLRRLLLLQEAAVRRLRQFQPRREGRHVASWRTAIRWRRPSAIRTSRAAMPAARPSIARVPYCRRRAAS